MRASSAILFPWQSTFARLELSKRWWHRLFIVLFFVGLVSLLGVSTSTVFLICSPVHSSMPDIQHWAKDVNGHPQQVTVSPPVTQAEYDASVKELPKGTDGEYSVPMPVGAYIEYGTPGDAALDYTSTITHKVAMPDGTTKEFAGRSDTEITAVWNKALARAIRRQWVLSITTGVVLTLVFSYLLQSLYRTLLYVVYGSQTSKGLKHSDEQTCAESFSVAPTHVTPGGQ